MMMSVKNNLFLLFVLILFIICVSCSDKDITGPKITGLIPSIASVYPNEGAIGTELTIIGTNFETGASVFVEEIKSNQVEVASATTIYATVPPGIPVNTALSVMVKNQGGGSATLTNVFTAIPPVLFYINSATKPSGNIGSTVILEGKAFGDNKNTGKVLFSDGTGGTIEAVFASVEDWTDNFIISTVPAGTKDGPVFVQTELGNSDSVTFKVTEAAIFSPSTINWTLAQELPNGVSGHKSIFVVIDKENSSDNYIYVSGGRDATATSLTQMLYARVNNDGTLNQWAETTPLPEALSFHSIASATPYNAKITGNGYIYILGGINSSGDANSKIYKTALNPDGTMGPWSETTPLLKTLHSSGAVIFRNNIYVVGGATTAGNTSNIPVNTVYKSTIGENGELGEWSELSPLANARSHHGLVSFGGYLYVCGGEKDTVSVDIGSLGTSGGLSSVEYGKINLRTGIIDSWAETSPMGKNRSKHTTLIAGGNIFVSSGLYSGLTGMVQGSSENIYAVIYSDGTIGSFNGATGSNTLFTSGGSNLFNQTGISYIDASGKAHVVIIGGAKVGSPSTKLRKVLFY